VVSRIPIGGRWNTVRSADPGIRVLSLGVLGIAAEVDRHAGLVTNDPRIVTWLDRGNVAGADLALLSAARLHPHAARQAVQQVRGLAAVGPCDRLEVLRPSPAGLECSVQARVACDGHHCCAALAAKGRVSSGSATFLISMPATADPPGSPLDPLSLSGPFVRVNVEVRGPVWSRRLEPLAP
jgi:hypothetical protein